MVKKIDKCNAQLLEHIGVDLWRAAQAWKLRLHSEMVARGHAWYGDARSVIAIHLDPQGMPQAELVKRVGLSKQAVQQLLDALEADGIVAREVDPDNRRAKRVTYTARGQESVREADAVKRSIELEYRDLLGERNFQTLRAALAELADYKPSA